MSENGDPRCTEVSVTASIGGKVQLVKYEMASDFHFSIGSRYAMPEGTTEREAEAFRHELAVKLREEIEPLAQAELDDLLEQKEHLKS